MVLCAELLRRHLPAHLHPAHEVHPLRLPGPRPSPQHTNGRVVQKYRKTLCEIIVRCISINVSGIISGIVHHGILSIADNIPWILSMGYYPWMNTKFIPLWVHKVHPSACRPTPHRQNHYPTIFSTPNIFTYIAKHIFIRISSITHDPAHKVDPSVGVCVCIRGSETVPRKGAVSQTPAASGGRDRTEQRITSLA